MQFERATLTKRYKRSTNEFLEWIVTAYVSFHRSTFKDFESVGLKKYRQICSTLCEVLKGEDDYNNLSQVIDLNGLLPALKQCETACNLRRRCYLLSATAEDLPSNKTHRFFLESLESMKLELEQTFDPNKLPKEGTSPVLEPVDWSRYAILSSDVNDAEQDDAFTITLRYSSGTAGAEKNEDDASIILDCSEKDEVSRKRFAFLAFVADLEDLGAIMVETWMELRKGALSPLVAGLVNTAVTSALKSVEETLKKSGLGYNGDFKSLIMSLSPKLFSDDEFTKMIQRSTLASIIQDNYRDDTMYPTIKKYHPKCILIEMLNTANFMHGYPDAPKGVYNVPKCGMFGEPYNEKYGPLIISDPTYRPPIAPGGGAPGSSYMRVTSVQMPAIDWYKNQPIQKEQRYHYPCLTSCLEPFKERRGKKFSLPLIFNTWCMWKMVQVVQDRDLKVGRLYYLLRTIKRRQDARWKAFTENEDFQRQVDAGTVASSKEWLKKRAPDDVALFSIGLPVNPFLTCSLIVDNLISNLSQTIGLVSQTGCLTPFAYICKAFKDKQDELPPDVKNLIAIFEQDEQVGHPALGLLQAMGLPPALAAAAIGQTPYSMKAASQYMNDVQAGKEFGKKVDPFNGEGIVANLLSLRDKWLDGLQGVEEPTKGNNNYAKALMRQVRTSAAAEASMLCTDYLSLFKPIMEFMRRMHEMVCTLHKEGYLKVYMRQKAIHKLAKELDLDKTFEVDHDVLSEVGCDLLAAAGILMTLRLIHGEPFETQTLHYLEFKFQCMKPVPDDVFSPRKVWAELVDVMKPKYDEAECCVCMAPYTPETRIALECGHLVCRKCCSRVLHKDSQAHCKCPICKSDCLVVNNTTVQLSRQPPIITERETIFQEEFGKSIRKYGLKDQSHATESTQEEMQHETNQFGEVMDMLEEAIETKTKLTRAQESTVKALALACPRLLDKVDFLSVPDDVSIYHLLATGKCTRDSGLLEWCLCMRQFDQALPGQQHVDMTSIGYGPMACNMHSPLQVAVINNNYDAFMALLTCPGADPSKSLREPSWDKKSCLDLIKKLPKDSMVRVVAGLIGAAGMPG